MNRNNGLVAATLSGIVLVSAGAIVAARYIGHEPRKPMTLEEIDREVDRLIHRDDPLPDYSEPLKEEPEKEPSLIFQQGTYMGNWERELHGLPPLPIKRVTIDPYYGLRTGEHSNGGYGSERSTADGQTRNREDTPEAVARRMARGAVDGFRRTDGTLYDRIHGAQAGAAVNAVVPEANEQFREVMRETAKGNSSGAVEKFMQMGEEQER